LIIEKVILSMRDRIDAVAVRAMAWSLIINKAAGDQSFLNLSAIDFNEDSQIH